MRCASCALELYFEKPEHFSFLKKYHCFYGALVCPAFAGMMRNEAARMPVSGREVP